MRFFNSVGVAETFSTASLYFVAMPLKYLGGNEILVNITLSDYNETTGAPHKQYVEVSGVDDFLFVTKYSKIQFDKPQKFSFNIPKNYEEIP